MRFSDLFKLSTRMFKARTSRTLLTILGMSIGIAAILFLVSLGYGLQKTLLERITTSDSLLTLDVAESKSGAVMMDKKLVDEISALEGVDDISPAFQLNAQGKMEDLSADVILIGAKPSFLRLAGTRLEKGTMLSDENPNGIKMKFDPYRQVQNRLTSLSLNGHNITKIELIVMGGTFSCLPKPYQKKFIAECFRAANEFGLKNKNEKMKKTTSLLSKEQKKNELASHRIIGLTLETRPDYITASEIANFRILGGTRVELGVQSIFNPVLAFNKRGHNIAATIRATKLLKDAGFKVGYHIMPGLPGSNAELDYQMFFELFNNSSFQPDLLKIYPTVVLKYSELYTLWKKNGYIPISNEQFEKFIREVKNKLIPPYVRLSRLVRDVPAASIIAGPTISNLRQKISTDVKCHCIRCREVGARYNIKEKIVLHRIDYFASDGKEIFLQFVSKNKNKLFALLRLRIPSNIKSSITALNNSAIIRELHTYGKVASLKTRGENSPQHIGLGKKLMREAEQIARKEFSRKKMSVIAGIGARQYYRKLGYRLKDTYMVKSI